ncbi:GABA transporter 1 [Hibiscus syriacus]|uniref:GABA transporter 1 n=1 Tax=Hibiscus syriacus TaxID=106335 RepID=A0A6A2YMG0_HIBSY|nr:GABA transporter 1 [Hibiscus syriacus]
MLTRGDVPLFALFLLFFNIHHTVVDFNSYLPTLSLRLASNQLEKPDQTTLNEMTPLTWLTLGDDDDSFGWLLEIFDGGFARLWEFGWSPVALATCFRVRKPYSKMSRFGSDPGLVRVFGSGLQLDLVIESCNLGCNWTSVDCSSGQVKSGKKMGYALLFFRIAGSWIHCGYHLTTSIVAPPLLSLPFAFTFLGWAAGIMCLVVGALVTFYSYNLQSLVIEHHDQLGRRHLNFRDMANDILRPRWGRYFVGPIQFMVCYGAVIACSLLGGQCMKAIYLLSEPNGSMKLYEFVIIFGILMLILAQVPSFHSLRHINLISLFLCLAYSSCAAAGSIYIAVGVVVLQPTNEVLERTFADPNSKEFSACNVIPSLVSRSPSVVISTTVAAMLPFFGDINAVIGAFGFMPLDFILPVVFFNLTFKPSKWSLVFRLNFTIAVVFSALGVIAAIAAVRHSS